MRKARTLLRVLRAAHEPRLTQIQMARLAGISSGARYWQIEHGEGNPPTDAERAAVAAVLNVSVTEIAWPDVDERTEASA